jgi:hypothetical protein
MRRRLVGEEAGQEADRGGFDGTDLAEEQDGCHLT